MSCTAAGSDCSVGTGIPGVFSQLQVCVRNNVQVQYCCPQGAHWTGQQYCSYGTTQQQHINTTQYHTHVSTHMFRAAHRI